MSQKKVGGGNVYFQAKNPYNLKKNPNNQYILGTLYII